MQFSFTAVFVTFVAVVAAAPSTPVAGALPPFTTLQAKPAPHVSEQLTRRDWCWDDGYNKGFQAKWDLCMAGQGHLGPVPHGQDDGCAWEGQPVENFRNGYQYAVDTHRECNF